jgi:DNA polymerase V
MSLEILIPTTRTKLKRPFFSVSVTAGFPSPADDHVDKNLDLNDYLIKHPAATFFVRATGDSMIDDGIHEGDLLIVDRALEAKDGSVIIAIINGELTVKRLKKTNGKVILLPANSKYNPIEVTEDIDFQVWGVVASVVHKFT